ncbi:hypothetical protein B6K69_10255 [Fuscovulum blasticum]|nr:hypothetical protein B6K69_10255 [Fuscovulum blasticum]
MAMYPARSSGLFRLTRRALGLRVMGGAMVAVAGPVTAPAQTAPDPDLRDAALRGLALAMHRGDPVAAAAARAAMERLAATDPEGALLARLYCALDVRPSTFYRVDMPPASADDLALLHRAIGASQPVFFAYTDLSDQPSQRSVLPLALVHPPQGVKLLAWCTERQGYRQFFVRAMHDLATCSGSFVDQRLTLLQGLVEKEGA